MVIEVVITMQLAMTEVERYVVDYNTECISAEKCIIPQIAGHHWVLGPPGFWSSGPLLIPTLEKYSIT